MDSLFADDPIVFLKDDLSLTNFLKRTEDYGTCSGLKVNHEKTELLVLSNLACTYKKPLWTTKKLNDQLKS